MKNLDMNSPLPTLQELRPLIAKSLAHWNRHEISDQLGIRRAAVAITLFEKPRHLIPFVLIIKRTPWFTKSGAMGASGRPHRRRRDRSRSGTSGAGRRNGAQSLRFGCSRASGRLFHYKRLRCYTRRRGRFRHPTTKEKPNRGGFHTPNSPQQTRCPRCSPVAGARRPGASANAPPS